MYLFYKLKITYHAVFFNIQLFPVIKITGNKKDIEYTRLTAKMCWGSNPFHHNDYRKGNEYEC